MSADLAVESRTIDFIPLSERYGTPQRLFTIWFSANMTILGVGVGTLGAVAGLSFWSAVIAIAVGNAIGTIFMAAHSAQGPQLGIPQMIQSRAQFGVRGAGLPLVAVVITYLLYSAADAVLVRSSIQSLLPMSDNTALVLFALATLIVAYAGYELIHRLGAVLTVVSTLLFLTAALLLVGRYGAHVTMPSVQASASRHAGLLMMTQAAAWSLSYGPYVADYSRYLPPDVPAARTFWYTASSNWLSSTLIMALGVYIGLAVPQLASSPGDAVAGIFGRARPVAGLLIIIGLIQGNVMNLYSAYMSTVTIVSGVRGMPSVSRRQKLLVMTVLIAIATGIAAVAKQNFDAYFGDVLGAMIYLLIPWSAINLADYYVVRKGQYNVGDMYRLTGIYGAYRWRTVAVYVIGILIQVPFMSLSFFKGSVANWLGSDFAWVPGLLVCAILYVAIEKGLGPTGAERLASRRH
jgi:nucleobase:cation symporter-1, NCS1 family